MDQAFMKDPTRVLMAYMKTRGIAADFKYGQLAMGLEVISLIRTLESIPVVNEAEKEGTIATLHTLLREQGLENAYEAYDGLAEWRKPTFVREPVLSANGDVVSRQSAVGRASVAVSASPPASRGVSTSPVGSSRASLWEHPSQVPGPAPTTGQLALPFGEGSETPTS